VVLFDRFMIEEQLGGVLLKTVLMPYEFLVRRLHCLRLSRQKAFRRNNFEISDLVVEEVAK
jgi:hypothetical protein